MKIKIHFFTVFMCLAFAMSGCTGNSDPLKGGFLDGIYFSITGKYRERHQEKQKDLNNIKAGNQALDQEYLTLRKKNQTLQEMRQSYLKDIEKLKQALNKLTNELNQVNATSSSAMARKEALGKTLSDLEEKIELEKTYLETATQQKMHDELISLINIKERLQNQILDLKVDVMVN